MLSFCFRSALLFLLFGLGCLPYLAGQAQPGWALDPYAGISAAFLQPAATAAIPYNWDLHLAGAAASVSNNSFFIRRASLPGLARDLLKTDAIELDDTNLAFRINGKTYSYDFTTHDKPVFVHAAAEVLGPAFSVQLGNFTRLGAFTRLRGVASTRRADPIFNYYNFTNTSASTPVPIGEFYAAAVAWAEVGGHLSRAFFAGNDGEVRLGLNLKFLLPMEGTAIYNPDGSSTVQEGVASRTIINGKTDIELTDGATGGGVAGQGIGADLGLQYAWGNQRSAGGYRYTVGVSVLDVGGITFNQRSRAYNFSNPDPVRLEGPLYDSLYANGGADAALDQLSRDFYDGNTSTARNGTSFNVGLPTMISAQFTVKPVRDVLIAAAYTGDLPLRTRQLSRGQQLVVSGHYSRWWYGASLSAGVYDWRGFNVGGQLRAGPFYIGSGRIFGSLLGTGELAAADFYFGLRLHDFGGSGGKKGISYKGKRKKGKKVKCYDF